LKVGETHSGKILGYAVGGATKLKDYLAVNYAAYFETAREKCSQVPTMFNRNTPVPLDSLYVKTYLDHLPDIHFLQLLARLSDSDSMRTFIITGSAGVGKTFFAKWLFLRLIEGQSSRIPFFIELRGINDNAELDILSFIHATIIGRRARVSLDAFKAGIKDGGYIFILDGLDEVETKRRSILMREMIVLQDSHPGLVSVITSRPDQRLNSWSLSRRYRVQPLQKKEVLSLISRLPYRRDLRRAFRDASKRESV
jgi:NACHT domain